MNKGLRKRKKILRTKTVDHHILYALNGCTHKQEEIVVPIYHTEHYIIKLLQTRGKYVSKGFLKHLRYFLWLYEDKAVDLEKQKSETD